ncbi:MAG: phosphoethanolamine transferase [Alteromonadaceae bacterium]|uniref:phosphoethanolamine transferase n=2 Tax=Paraglaciecola chathamensis TaxID=368405 RepID=UPI000C5585E2|nr:phosphoethanolamine--lipid A transferase [Paraglaciecola agarilytica]MBN28186.1 phosphoethanolamine transferase [Alteromonadaceae bacterium]
MLKFKSSVNNIILIASAYITVLFNFPFFNKVFHTVTLNETYNIYFLISVPILLFSLMTIFNSLFSSRFIFKPFLIFTFLLSSILFYATFHYGVIFDYGMIQNSVETDSAEIFSYFNFYAIIFFLFFGLIPSVLVFYIKLERGTITQELFSRIRLVTIFFVIIGTIVSLFYVNYASVGRNNRELTSYLTPFKFYEASYKYMIRSLYNSSREFRFLDIKPTQDKSETKPKITVLVLGETARAKNFSLNGYGPSTNAYTASTDIVSFSNFTSCGTATAVSVPCMFSRLNKENYDKHIADSQQNVLDLINLSGVDVMWIDNNNGGCKGVCKRVKTIEIDVDQTDPLCDGEYCFDQKLLEPLEQKIKNLKADNTLIVLHMIGSHGPTYFKRYPKIHRKFVPDCQRSDIQNCSTAELINTYDNTILYTDFVLKKIIERLENISITGNFNSSLLFISDHGESLGENGFFLHGFPYLFAPKEQTHIPMLYWQNAKNTQFNLACIRNKATLNLSHDNFFDTLLGITEVNTSAYDPEKDILNSCNKNT